MDDKKKIEELANKIAIRKATDEFLKANRKAIVKRAAELLPNCRDMARVNLRMREQGS